MRDEWCRNFCTHGGQIAELVGDLFPIAFIAGAVVAGYSSYSYLKFSSAYLTSGGISNFYTKAYGPGIATGSFSLLMDIAIHWGLFRYLQKEVKFNFSIPKMAILMDIIILAVFIYMKYLNDPFVSQVTVTGIVLIFLSEYLFMKSHADEDGNMDMNEDTIQSMNHGRTMDM